MISTELVINILLQTSPRVVLGTGKNSPPHFLSNVVRGDVFYFLVLVCCVVRNYVTFPVLFVFSSLVSQLS